MSDGEPVRYGGVTKGRRALLLTAFCVAQFMDAFNGSALFSALPTLVRKLHMTENESPWVISAYQLTFAAFLLLGGRIADVYNPKTAFIVGFAGLGCICIGAGFADHKIPLITLRAISGIAASLTIPSALHLLVKFFPEPAEQGGAIGLFGGAGALGNVLGLIIGALFVQFASWSWVFWFAACVAIPTGVICLVLIPPQTKEVKESVGSRLGKLDVVGVATLTTALILFIFAVTSGSQSGWGSARVIAPLVIGVVMVFAFLFYETRIPPAIAAVPPQTWFLTNFSVLFGSALLPWYWWAAVFTIFTQLWQSVYGWSVIKSAVHFLPIGIVAFPVGMTGGLAQKVDPKWLIMFGQILMIVGTALLSVATKESDYWRLCFPAFLIGSSGAMFSYTHSNIAIFATAPPAMAGTVGAIFNGALQLGSAVGLAVAISIETSVEAKYDHKHGTKGAGFRTFHGRSAALWFVLAVVALEALAVLVFYKTAKQAAAQRGDAEDPHAAVASGKSSQEPLELPAVHKAEAEGISTAA